MSGILPTKPVKATRINPKILLLYGVPKVGKTSTLAKLDNCLTLDTEKGADMYDMLRLTVSSVTGKTILNPDGSVFSTSINDFIAGMEAEAKRQLEAKEQLRFPYKYIAVDTLDRLEDYCEISATALYKATTIGKNFDGKSVLDLPNGAG